MSTATAKLGQAIAIVSGANRDDIRALDVTFQQGSASVLVIRNLSLGMSGDARR